MYFLRLPSGVTTVVRNLPPGTVFYEPSQLRTATGQPVVPHHIQPQPLLKCSICSEIFHDEAKFKQHAFMHEQLTLLKNDPPKLPRPGTYECKFCHAIFEDKDNLRKHYDEKHEKEYANTQPIEPMYQCALCDLSFQNLSALTQHQQTHTQRKEVYILPKQIQGMLGQGDTNASNFYLVIAYQKTKTFQKVSYISHKYIFLLK